VVNERAVRFQQPAPKPAPRVNTSTLAGVQAASRPPAPRPAPAPAPRPPAPRPPAPRPAPAPAPRPPAPAPRPIPRSTAPATPPRPAPAPSRAAGMAPTGMASARSRPQAALTAGAFGGVRAAQKPSAPSSGMNIGNTLTKFSTPKSISSPTSRRGPSGTPATPSSISSPPRSRVPSGTKVAATDIASPTVRRGSAPAPKSGDPGFLHDAIAPISAQAERSGGAKWYHYAGDVALGAATFIPIGGQILRGGIIARAGVQAGAAAVRAGAGKTAAGTVAAGAQKALPSAQKALPFGPSANMPGRVPPSVPAAVVKAGTAIKGAAVDTGRFVKGYWQGAGQKTAEIRHLAKTSIEAGVMTAAQGTRLATDKGYREYATDRFNEASKRGPVAATAAALTPLLSPTQDRLGYAQRANTPPLTVSGSPDTMERQMAAHGAKNTPPKWAQNAALVADLANPVNVLIGSAVATGVVRGVGATAKLVKNLKLPSFGGGAKPTKPLALPAGGRPIQTPGQGIPEHAGLPGTRSAPGGAKEGGWDELVEANFPLALRPGGGGQSSTRFSTGDRGTYTRRLPPDDVGEAVIVKPPTASGSPASPSAPQTPTGSASGSSATSRGASSSRFSSNGSQPLYNPPGRTAPYNKYEGYQWGRPQKAPAQQKPDSRPFAEPPEPDLLPGTSMVPFRGPGTGVASPRPSGTLPAPIRSPYSPVRGPARAPGTTLAPTRLPARAPGTTLSPARAPSTSPGPKPTNVPREDIATAPVTPPAPAPRQYSGTVVSPYTAPQTAPNVATVGGSGFASTYPPPPVLPGLLGREGSSGPSGLHRGWWGGTDVSAQTATGGSYRQGRLVSNPRLASVNLPSAYTGQTPGTQFGAPESYTGASEEEETQRRPRKTTKEQ